MSKETMTAEVREAIAKAGQFADMEPEKVTGEVEPTTGGQAVMPEPEQAPPEKPETVEKPKKAQKPATGAAGKQAGGKRKTGKKAEVMSKEDAKAALMKAQEEKKLKREFEKRSGVIEKNLATIENSFLTIAFQLHWIKANKMYKTAGFKNIYDYAESQHGIGRTSCSNLVCIIENFAERDENGQVVEKIAECYRKFKQSQLVAMMGMSPEQIARIDENTSVRAINRMKQDLEVEMVPGDESGAGEEDDNGLDGTEAGEKPEPVKKIVNTLIQFNNYNKYQNELEEVDMLIERAFKKSTLPVTIKIVCEQG